VQIKNRQQALAVAAIGLVGLFAADKVLFSPLYRAWSARGEQIAKYRKQIDEGQHLIQRERSLRSQWDQWQSNTLPNDTSAAEQQVLKAFDRWAQQSRVSVTSFTPQWKRDSEDYMTLECRVDASGNLQTLSQFLYNIEKDPMALQLESVEITARDKAGQQLALGLQISGLTLTLGAKSESLNR
jgi:Tfp pilus assembly protein PilO